MKSTPEPESGWQSARELWTVTADKSGSNPSPEKDRLSHSTSRHEDAGRKRYRIVVIEDNKADIFLVQEAVALQGIEAELEVIMDGEEAIRRIGEFQGKPNWLPDAFVLDLNLPKRPGVEVLAFIRETLVSTRIPVLIMTSSDSKKDREETKRLDADGYFRKPSTYDEFLKIGSIIKELLAARPPSAL